MKNKFIRWLKRHKRCLIICSLIFFFPLFVGNVYTWKLPQWVAVESGDLLSYYATVFGILGSFIIYRNERKDKETERKKELRPSFVVELKKSKDYTDVFNLIITKQTESVFSQLYLYDVFVSNKINHKNEYKVSYNKSVEFEKEFSLDCNANYDDILDDDGYPKFIQICCDDMDGNSWDCYYFKINDCGKIYYHSGNFEFYGR